MKTLKPEQNHTRKKNKTPTSDQIWFPPEAKFIHTTVQEDALVPFLLFVPQDTL